jgi:hypothetical protein
VNKRIMPLLVNVSLTALIMILVMSVFSIVFPQVKAQTVVATRAYLSVEPNPVGVMQLVTLSMRIEPPPPSPTDRFTGLIIHDLSLGDTNGGFGPYFTDSNGSASITQLFTHVGTYSFQLNYSGESFANGTVFYEGATSAVITLNVGQTIPSPTPEPTSTPPSTSEPTPTPFASPTPSPTATPLPTPQPTTENPESFPTMLVVASLASVAAISAGLLLYLKKRRVKSGGAT